MAVGPHGKRGAPAVCRAAEVHRRARAVVTVLLRLVAAADAGEVVLSPTYVAQMTVKQQACLAVGNREAV